RVGAGCPISDPAARGGWAARLCLARGVQWPALYRQNRRALALDAQRSPPLAAVYQQAQRWLAAGCFEQLAHDLRAVLRQAAGRAEDPSAAIVDSRTLRSSPESGERAGYDG